MPLNNSIGRGRFPVIPSQPIRPMSPINLISPEEPEIFCPSISLPATDQHPSFRIRSTIPRDVLLSLSRQNYKDYVESQVPGLEIYESSTETRSSYISSPPSPLPETSSSGFHSILSEPLEANPVQIDSDPSEKSVTPTTLHGNGSLSPMRPSKSRKFRLTKIKKSFQKLSKRSQIPKPTQSPKLTPPSPKLTPPIPTITIEEVSTKNPTLPPYFPYTRYVPTQIPRPSSPPPGSKPRCERQPRAARRFPQSLPRLTIPPFIPEARRVPQSLPRLTIPPFAHEARRFPQSLPRLTIPTYVRDITQPPNYTTADSSSPIPLHYSSPSISAILDLCLQIDDPPPKYDAEERFPLDADEWLPHPLSANNSLFTLNSVPLDDDEDLLEFYSRDWTPRSPRYGF